jgi:2-polyprenyl-3-methyl-5-hydroxy-6-metoxy-1,4-benzoquinol methylase
MNQSKNTQTHRVNLHGIVLLATLGEHEVIAQVLSEVRDAINSAELKATSCQVLIIDDSRDTQFHRLVESLLTEMGINGTIVAGNNQGLGGAIRFGFDIALLDEKIDFLINLDSDGQHNGLQIPKLFSKHQSQNLDITIGSRWTKNGSAVGMPKYRKILSRLAAFVLHRAGVDSQIKDPTTSFRIYSRDAVKLVRREAIDLDGFAFFGGAIAIGCSNGLLIAETPIDFRPRYFGKSKLSTRRVIESALQLWRIASKSRMLRLKRKFQALYGNERLFDASGVIMDHEVMVCAEAKTADHLISYLGSEVSGKILEVGAGAGSFSENLSKVAESLVCIEPVDSYFTELERIVGSQSNTELFHGTLKSYSDVRKQEGTEKRFDRLFYAHVLEHIEDDISELQLAKDQLEQNGKIIVVVPSLPRLYGSVDSLSGHYRRYTKKELIMVAREAGLEVESIKFFNPLAIFPYWIMYRLLKVRSVGSGQLGVYDRLIVPVAYKMIDVVRGKIIGINLIAILSPRSK